MEENKSPGGTISHNTSVIVGNETMISDSIADNPDRHYYQIVYGSFILVILATSLIRGFSFMKVIIVHLSF
ncbi:Multidrug resistance-associated protein 5 [Portunus trituberculatus]|uniref:Multidrug resistance-associated protein 5 n=1 Tax=Portunus trituberculatus TaxID=210409 RepID=A0A5B7I8S6_PORTR|nr:Multidrug resistance-associated protein 5 [Portunus trituberculatus]